MVTVMIDDALLTKIILCVMVMGKYISYASVDLSIYVLKFYTLKSVRRNASVYSNVCFFQSNF